MKYLLDTNVASDYLRGIESVVKKIQKAKPSDLAISAITVMELRYSAARRQSAKLTRAIDTLIHGVAVVGFDADAGEQAGRLRAAMEAKGMAIALADCQIAATAQTLDLTLVSSDDDLKRVPKLKIVDWRSKES